MPRDRLLTRTETAQARERLALHKPRRTLFGRLRCAWCDDRWHGDKRTGACPQASWIAQEIADAQTHAARRDAARRRFEAEARAAYVAHVEALARRPRPHPTAGRNSLADTSELPMLEWSTAGAAA